MERNGILILDPLNAVWFAVLAIFIAVLVLASILLSAPCAQAHT